MSLKKMVSTFTNQYLPKGLALKGLINMENDVSKFVTSSLAYGYGADQVLDFLRGQFQTGGEKEERQRLKTQSLTPQERMIRADQRTEDKGYETIANVAALAGGAAGLVGKGGQVAAQALPKAAKGAFRPPEAKKVLKEAEKLAGVSKVAEGLTPEKAFDVFRQRKIDNVVTQLAEQLDPETGYKALVQNFGKKSLDQMAKEAKAKPKELVEKAFQYVQGQGGGMEAMQETVTAAQPEQTQGIDPALQNAISAFRADLQKIRSK